MLKEPEGTANGEFPGLAALCILLPSMSMARCRGLDVLLQPCRADFLGPSIQLTSASTSRWRYRA